MWIRLKGTKERARRAGVHAVRTRLSRTAQKVRIWHDVGKDIRNIWPFVRTHVFDGCSRDKKIVSVLFLDTKIYRFNRGR